jgi:hypothetical protein
MDLWTIAKLDDAVGFAPCRILDLNAEYRARRPEYVASLSMKNAKGPPLYLRRPFHTRFMDFSSRAG